MGGRGQPTLLRTGPVRRPRRGPGPLHRIRRLGASDITGDLPSGFDPDELDEESADCASWIFGYGSLVFRPGFEHVERRHGFILDFARRFYQGSTDHRGRPGAPGRVATLVPDPGAVCFGVAYRVEGEARDRVLERLDHREKGGYERFAVNVFFAGHPAERALIYVATDQNANWLGEASIADMAAHIASSEGPSGTNRDYVLRLADALRTMGADDPHVFALESAVRAAFAEPSEAV